MASRFELEKFAIEPSAHQLDICRKEDLLSIADLYQIQVTLVGLGNRTLRK